MRKVSANIDGTQKIFPNQYQNRKLVTLILLVPLLISLGTNVLHAQKLNGKYVLRLNNSHSEEVPNITISDGKFSQIIYGHVGNAVSEGTVQLKSRKLTFKYLEVPNQDSSHYTVKTYPIKVGRDTAILHLRAVEEGTGPNMVVVWCVDSLNKVLSTSFTDKAGNKYLSIPANRTISKVVIFSLGYFDVRLPLSKFYGHSSEINIELKKVRVAYSHPPDVTYKVVSFMKDEILLKDEKSNRYNLQRIKE